MKSELCVWQEVDNTAFSLICPNGMILVGSSLTSTSNSNSIIKSVIGGGANTFMYCICFLSSWVDLHHLSSVETINKIHKNRPHMRMHCLECIVGQKCMHSFHPQWIKHLKLGVSWGKTQRSLDLRGGGLFLIPLPGFIRACRHLSSITGCHGGYVVAWSPSALLHSETCWELNVMILPKRGRKGHLTLEPLWLTLSWWDSCNDHSVALVTAVNQADLNPMCLVKIQTLHVKLVGWRTV